MLLMARLRQVAQRHGERTAVLDGREQILYRDLLQRVEQARVDLPPGRRVLLSLPRGVGLVVQLLAAWDAGQVPLLLDPDLPSQRRREIQELADQPDEHTVAPAYLVSTSGSSGTPKLVEVLEDGLVPMLEAQIQAFDLQAGDRVVWMLSPGFDASLSDIGTALLSGATLCCAPAEVVQRLPETVQAWAGTHLDIPPALLPLFNPDDFPTSLRTLIVGGAPSEPSLLRRWARRFRVVAVYGPTEATVCSSLSVVDEGWDAPYIGQPIAGLRYDVRDGELFIGGPGVARGYAGQLSPSFTFESGLRWYRTGDLVRSSDSPHGLIFAGRRDRQVQLHGQRVEPEEIEIRLLALMREVAVAPLPRGLAVFWAGPDGAEQQAREALEQSLPAAWVPRVWRQVNSLPRLAGGKVDFAALRRAIENSSEEDSLETLRRVVELEKAGISAEDLLQGAEPARSLRTLEATAEALLIERGKARKARPTRPVLLVTGGGGRLGRALLPLLKEHVTLIALQRRTLVPEAHELLSGDLLRPRLGLSARQWKSLKPSAVLHLGARVQAGATLTSMLEVNARPLLTLGELGVPIHLASTLAVTLRRRGEEISGAYAQSKVVAEHLCRVLSPEGWIFRYGLLLAAPPTADQLLLALQGLRSLGCFPREGAHLTLDVTPMELAAQATAQCLRSEKSPATVAISAGATATLADLVKALRRAGCDLSPVSSQEFFALTPNDAPAVVAQLSLGRLRDQHPDWDLFLMPRRRSRRLAPLVEGILDSYARTACASNVPAQSP